MTQAAFALRAPVARRLVGFNLFSAIALGIGGFFLGAYLGGQIAVGKDYLLGTDQNDVGVFMGYLFATVGWLAGLGFFNYPVSRLLGRPAALPAYKEPRGIGRYFGLSLDHKVIGIQYFFGIGFFFFVGGLNAMLIRTELLTPNERAWPAGQYISLVGLHGTMMIMMKSARSEE